MTVQTPAPQAALTLVSQTLGPLEVPSDRALRLLEPLAGFPECGRYALMPHLRDGEASASIQWFQALDAPFHAFIVADPWSIFPDYAPELAQADARLLELGSAEDALLLVILTVSSAPSAITANLRAPIVVNRGERVAKQVVLLGDAYGTRHAVRREG